jgi:hypothetical protein
MESKHNTSDDTKRTEVLSVYDEINKREFYKLLKADKIDSAYKLAINIACWRPEFKPLLRDICISVTDNNDNVFFLDKKDHIVLSDSILPYPAATAFYLRHAMELVVLHRCIPSPASLIDFISLAIAAFHTALAYLDNMIDRERQAVYGTLPAWVKQTIEQLEKCNSHENAEHERLRNISLVLDNLLPLQNHAYPSDYSKHTESDIEKAIDKLLPITRLLAPAEKILTTGGDNRLLTSRQTSLNTYGCSPRPREWAITFSSSTGSSISEFAYLITEKTRQTLISKTLSDSQKHDYSTEYRPIREEISRLLKLEKVPGTRIILTPSGTDAEFYALYLAMGKNPLPTTNILISSTEIGSGTAYAAKGQHFDTLTSTGNTVRKGEPLNDFPSHLVDISFLELHHDNGKLKSMDELDTSLEEMVQQPLLTGKQILIHLLDCSKTGLEGPGFEKIQQLQKKNPRQIHVVVDAAQMRIGNSALHRYLDTGFMVLISGSKFFTGPPFSGALLIPQAIGKQVHDYKPIPNGLADYSSLHELDPLFHHLAEQRLSSKVNYGLILRWHAAIWEMKAFNTVHAQDRYLTLSQFSSCVTKMIEDNPDLERVMIPPHFRAKQELEQCWDQLPSIFTFVAYKRNPDKRSCPLDNDQAHFAYQCINQDVSHFLPVQASDREYELARKHCHIGQPVCLHDNDGNCVGGLRISAGARLVSGVQFDYAFGNTPAERLETEIRTVGIALSKLSVILKYWDVLNSYDLNSRHTQGSGYHQY